jgi:hypothetical protein
LEVFLMILMMAAFLRESEAAALDLADVWLERIEDEDVLFVYVGKSKTDKERRGHSILVGKAEHHHTICPINWFRIAEQQRPANAEKFFCRPDGKALLAAEPNKILKKLLRSRPDVDASLYGSHSLRKVGCTEAARAGVEITLLKRHGNWKSDAVFTYIKNSIKERLSVSQSFIKAEFQSMAHYPISDRLRDRTAGEKGPPRNFLSGVGPCLGKDTCVDWRPPRARSRTRRRDMTTEFIACNKWCCNLTVLEDSAAGGMSEAAFSIAKT